MIIAGGYEMHTRMYMHDIINISLGVIASHQSVQVPQEQR